MKAALEEGDPEVFLVALRDVAAAILSEGKDLQELQHELAEARKEIEEAKALIAKHFRGPHRDLNNLVRNLLHAYIGGKDIREQLLMSTTAYREIKRNRQVF